MVAFCADGATAARGSSDASKIFPSSLDSIGNSRVSWVGMAAALLIDDVDGKSSNASVVLC